MARDSERPSGQEIDDKIEYLTRVWRDSRTNWADTDTYIQLEFEVWKKEQAANRGEFHPSTAHNIINHASDQNLAHLPTVRRDPIDPDKDSDKEAANRVEEAMKHVLMDSAMKSMKGPPWKQLFKHLNAYGYGPLKLELDLSEPVSARAHPGHWNPVRFEATHPGRVLIDPLSKVPDSAVDMIQMSVGKLERLLERKKNLKHYNGFERGTRNKWDILDLAVDWTMDWTSMKEIGKEPIYQQPNTWKIVPFTHAFAGYGIEPTVLNKHDPKHLAEGILDPVKDTLRMQAQSMTGQQTLIMDQIYAPYGTSADATALTRALDTGEVLRGDKEQYWKLGIDQLPRGVFEHGQKLENDIQRGTMAPSLMGERTPGISTIGEAALLNDIQMRKFSALTQQIEAMASILASWILQLVDRVPQLKGGIGANGHALMRKDIKKFHHVNVSFPVLNMAMQLQLREIALREVELGGLSWLTYWEKYALHENTSQEETRLMQQRVRNHPSVLARDAAVTAEAMDDIDAEDVEAIRSSAEEGDLPVNAPPPGAEVARELRQPLSNGVVKPARIDIG